MYIYIGKIKYKTKKVLRMPSTLNCQILGEQKVLLVWIFQHPSKVKEDCLRTFELKSTSQKEYPSNTSIIVTRFASQQKSKLLMMNSKMCAAKLLNIHERTSTSFASASLGFDFDCPRIAMIPSSTGICEICYALYGIGMGNAIIL